MRSDFTTTKMTAEHSLLVPVIVNQWPADDSDRWTDQQPHLWAINDL